MARWEDEIVSRRPLAALFAVALALAGVFHVAYPVPPLPFRSEAIAMDSGARDWRFSMFAIGDTGESHWLPSLREGQLSVARELTAADIERPANALVLLGDNFYPNGLTRSELVRRIRSNLVWPYCRFVELHGDRSAEVAGACTLPEGLRRSRAVSIHAVLGNHDHTAPESPALQSDVIPRFVSNWHLPRGLANVVEFEAGVSLILIDSTALRTAADVSFVRNVLQSARGPWRFVLGHHPIARLHPADPHTAEPSSALLRRAIEESDVPVHLYVSGHRHNLQGIEMEEPGPFLHVIVGAGATVKPIERHYLNRSFAMESTGFARFDIIGVEGQEELIAQVYATQRFPLVWWKGARRVARWTVSPSGAITRKAP